MPHIALKFMSYNKVELGDGGQDFRLYGMVVDIDIPIAFGFFVVVVSKLKLILNLIGKWPFMPL